MASFVKAADAIAAAVEIEKRGHAFYLDMSAKAEHKADKDFFAFMAGEEMRHETIFTQMLGRVGGVDLPAGSDDEEYLVYVQALLDSHSLFTKDRQSVTLESPVGQAIQFEKDTLLFFLAIEDMVPQAEREFVRACANEERAHLRMLAQHISISK